MRSRIALLTVLVLGCSVLVGARRCGPNKPPRLDPLRLYSIGDSITRAFDAWFILDNLSLSWANGYHGTLQQILGIPNINSHNQRITAQFGSAGRTNVIEAQNGARWDDAVAQAAAVAAEAPTYVTVMLGGNDVCRDTIEDLPSDAEIQGHVRDLLDLLEQDLPAGATVVVVGIPDVKRLHDVAIVEKGLLGINCSAIWQTTALGFPCGSMLSPDNTEADRLFVQSRNFAYNDIIQFEVAVQNSTSTKVYYHFFDAEPVEFTGDDISSIDCFHPSAAGEALISQLTWEMGPFGP